MYVGGTLAAAAVIAMAFLGLFDNRESKVAGVKEIRIERASESAETDFHPVDKITPIGATDGTQETLEAWIDRARNNLAIKRESGASLREFLDNTATQWDHLLHDADSEPVSPKDAPPAIGENPPAPADDVDPDVPGDSGG